MIVLEAGGRRATVEVAAHACQLATTTHDAEATARAFVRDGLRAGDRCVALVPEAPGLLEYLDGEGIDPDQAFESGRLRFDDIGPARTVGQGTFDPYRLVARHLTDSCDMRTSGRVRILVDMHWYGGPGEAEAILRYEAASHAAMRAHADHAVVLAQYRFGDLSGDTVIDLLRLHPSAVVAQFIRRNPNPADPVSFMARLLHRTIPQQ